MDVDAILGKLRGLLGEGQVPTLPERAFGEPVPAVASWTGRASDAAHAASTDLERQRSTLAETYGAVGPLIARSGEVATSARARVDEIRQQWRNDQQRLEPFAHTPAGKTALLAAGQLRVSEATRAVQEAQTAFAAFAGQVQTLAGRLPATAAEDANGANGSIQLVDYTTDPNDPYYDNPPEPGGGYGSYHYGYQFDTKEGWTEEQIMSEVQQNFNKYFTFTGDKGQLVEGADINLKGPLGEDEPVRVTEITPNSFSFVSLPGHMEGPGRVIKFSVVPAEASPVPGRLNWEMRVAASGPLSLGSLVPGASWGNKAIWQVFANNLDSRLPSLPPQLGRGSF